MEADIVKLYKFADEHGYRVFWYTFDDPDTESLSITRAGEYAIGIDPDMLSSLADERVKMAHELGHCETGSFYNEHSPYDVRAQHERRADKWAIKKLIPWDELESAVQAGVTELWDLAELFSVTEDFMKKAVEFYRAQEYT